MRDRTHDDIVSDWKANAQAHDEESFDFCRSLKRRSSPEKVDRVASQLHKEVFQIIDCTRCCNCCRTLHPMFTDEDIDRIAAHLGQTRDEFIAAHLQPDECEPDCYRTRALPCPLLGEDGRCTVYDVRPEACREYPHTDKEDFVFHAISRASSALTCPAAFAVIEGMKRELGRRRRRGRSQP